MAVSISVENLGKQYRIAAGTGSHRYDSLRDAIAGLLTGRKRAPDKTYHGDFWALRDCTFDINEGERVGVIGRNGAGKSTLLKILSRITEPTTGTARIRGRASSLLEVGTGFHPELSGRENIFLNGAILGMARSEVASKFEEIVEFAEVGQFLDTPVKHYSSGMYVRLAFSVAAHLEPDILIVDEVLAVGDAHFQKKCLGKMHESERAGRTVVFVSHNMSTITSLCPRTILLERGRVAYDGPTSQAVLSYYGTSGSASAAFNDFSALPAAVGDDEAQLLDCAIVDLSGKLAPEVAINQDFRVRMRYRLLRATSGVPVPNFHFLTAEGAYAFVSAPERVDVSVAGVYIAECAIPAHFLNEGMYSVSVALTTNYPDGRALKTNFLERSAISFNVRDPMDETVVRHGWSGPIPGVVRPKLEWTVRSAAQVVDEREVGT